MEEDSKLPVDSSQFGRTDSEGSRLRRIEAVKEEDRVTFRGWRVRPLVLCVATSHAVRGTSRSTDFLVVARSLMHPSPSLPRAQGTTALTDPFFFTGLRRLHSCL